jgi:hypothetical protein
MKQARIATRLTDASARARRPFQAALGVATAAAAREHAPPFARVALFWRRLGERRCEPGLGASRNTYLAVQVSQRLDLHFTCQSVMIAGQATDREAGTAAPRLPHAGDVLRRRRDARAGDGFRAGPATAELFGRREGTVFALLWSISPTSPRSPTSPMVPMSARSLISPVAIRSRRVDRNTDQPDAPSGRAVPRRFDDQPGLISLWDDSRPAAATSWPQDSVAGPRSGTGPASLFQRIAGKYHQGSPRAAKGSRPSADPGPSLGPLTMRNHLRPGKLSATPALTPGVAPARLRWRERVANDDTLAPPVGEYRGDSSFGPHASLPATADRLARAEDNLITRACAAARDEMRNGASIERLADDVMRRLDKRLRVERERHGF